MELFTISEVAAAVGLSLPPGREEVSVPCPSCDRDGKGGKHLCINIKDGVYNCPRCGIHGGTLALYGLYKGCDNNRQVVRELIAWRNGGAVPVKAPETGAAEKVSCELATLEKRNAVYRRLFDCLDLSEAHKQALAKRGIPEIYQYGYRTTPAPGTEADLCRRIMADGLTLDGVPGFFKLKSGDWAIVRQQSGIMIPVMTETGMTEGLQVRLDETAERKYRWLSSSGYDHGTGAKAACHIAGAPEKTMLLTEGPLKADVIYGLSGRSVIAVPGVNALSYLDEALDRLKASVGLEEIWVCYDMDLYDNPHVRKANAKLLELLRSKGITARNYKWDTRYKGLDDYLLAVRMKEITG